MLPHAAAKRQHMVEGKAHFGLPEIEHGFEAGREEADIDAWFGKVQGTASFVRMFCW